MSSQGEKLIISLSLARSLARSPPLSWHLIVNHILSGQGWKGAVQECFNIAGMPNFDT